MKDCSTQNNSEGVLRTAVVLVSFGGQYDYAVWISGVQWIAVSSSQCNRGRPWTFFTIVFHGVITLSCYNSTHLSARRKVLPNEIRDAKDTLWGGVKSKH